MKIVRAFNSIAAGAALLIGCDDDAKVVTPNAEIIDVSELEEAQAETSPEVAPETSPEVALETTPDAAIETDTAVVETDATTAETITEISETADTSNPVADQLIADGEALFFRALAGETNLRTEAILKLSSGVTLDPNHARGQLMYGMALLSSVAEDANLFAALSAQPALEKAMALAPDDLRIPGWLGTVKVGAARALNTGVAEAVAFMIEAADAFPEFNNVSLAIGFGRFPLDTPYPQMAIDRLTATANCVGEFDVCRNTERVPHNNEGALMLFGDVYARVGDTAKARYFYELALGSPDAATWDYAGDAQAVLDALDDRVALYLDADPANDPQFFAEGRVACVACHAP